MIRKHYHYWWSIIVKRGDVNASLQETLITGDESKTVVYIGHHHAPTSTNAKEHPSKLEFNYTGFDVTNIKSALSDVKGKFMSEYNRSMSATKNNLINYRKQLQIWESL